MRFRTAFFSYGTYEWDTLKEEDTSEMTAYEKCLVQTLEDSFFHTRKALMTKAKTHHRVAWRAALMASDAEPGTVSKFYKNVPAVKASIDEFLNLAKNNFQFSGIAFKQLK